MESVEVLGSFILSFFSFVLGLDGDRDSTFFFSLPFVNAKFATANKIK